MRSLYPLTIELPEALAILEPRAWRRPPDYGGFNPEGDYVICTQNRDSSILEQTNYKGVYRLLECTADVDAPVYDWRAGHWAVGWVEYLMVSRNAPACILREAAQILEALDGYPVLDDEAYSNAQFNAVYDYWESMPIAERVDYCRDSGCSIFGARNKYEIPEQVYDRLSEQFG
jgi:hypothetical protein